MEEWNQKGAEDWNVNQQIKKERERKALEFDYKQVEKYRTFTMNKINDATREVNDGIEEFEKTLRKQGIEPRVTKEFAAAALATATPSKSQTRSPMGRSPVKTTGGFGASMAAATKTKAASPAGKAAKTQNDTIRKERERRRRRKMIVEQGKKQIELENERRKSQIVDRLHRQSKQEQELEYEAWRTQQCKNIVFENRKLREARYQARR